LVAEGIGTLVIGKNPLWKQEVQLGTRTNQQFVQIPHARFIDQLTYKAKLVGITVILQEESYTSKASFLDNDPIPTYQADRAEHPVFSGSRIARSWYRAGDGTVLHADVNGSYTILRKRSSDPRPSGARRSGRGSSPQTAGALKRMPDRHIGHHFKILFFLPLGCFGGVGAGAIIEAMAHVQPERSAHQAGAGNSGTPSTRADESGTRKCRADGTRDDCYFGFWSAV
jgi:IS605 OrfB family transposase